MGYKPSRRALEVLQIIADGADCWGEVWTHYPSACRPGLSFRNFDRVCDAMLKHGLVTDQGAWLRLTELGSKAIGK